MLIDLKPLARAAFDGLLNVFVEILYADAHAVETELAEQFDSGVVDLARIDLDRILAVFNEPEMLTRRRHQLAHLVVREEGRRAAAPVQLRHLVVAGRQEAALQG